ncbi:MAG: AMP-binding protein, partial [Steroidobacteraceae bacterium]
MSQETVADHSGTFAEQLRSVLKLDPAQPALEHVQRWYTWGELNRCIDQLDIALEQVGARGAARVGILIRSRPGSYAAIAGLLASQRVLVTLNPILPADRLCEDVKSLRLPVLVGERDDLAIPGVLDVLRASGTAVIELAPDLSSVRTLPSFERIRGSDLLMEDAGTAIVMLTSGTTGKPKRVPLARKSLERALMGALHYERGHGEDPSLRLRSGVTLIASPLTHIGGMYFIGQTILSGRKACLLEKFTVQEWRDLIVRHQIRISNIVPAALRMILEANVAKEDLKSLIALRTGTAPLDPAITDEFLRRYDLPVLQTYGATEFAGAVAGWGIEDFRQ